MIQNLTGFELLSYTTATLTAPFTYALTGLYRGLYSTTSAAFSLGASFMYLDTTANYFEDALPPQYINQNFWVKLQSFNIFNSYTAPLSACAAFQYSTIGPIPPVPGPLPRAPRRAKTLALPKLRRHPPTPVVPASLLADMWDDGGVLALVPVLGTSGWPTSPTSLSAGALWNNMLSPTVVPPVTPNPLAPPVYFGNITSSALLSLGGANLPTTQPTVGSLQLWNNGGTVCVA